MAHIYLVIDVVGRVVDEALTLDEARQAASSHPLASCIADDMGTILVDVATREAKEYAERYRREMQALDRNSEAA